MILSLVNAGENAALAMTGRQEQAGSRPIQALVVSADPSTRQRLRRLGAQEADVRVLEECADAHDAARRIEALRPDVAIIDLDVAQRDGFAIAAAVSHLEPAPLFIYVSGCATQAMPAFRAAALDFLMKPIQPAEFATAIHRARGKLMEQSSAAMGHRLAALLAGLAPEAAAVARPTNGELPSGAGYLERIPVRSDDRVVYVRSRDVSHCEANGNYVHLHVGKQRLQIRQTLGALEQQLDPRRFVRIHRRTIVNVDCVRELQPWFAADYVVLLADGTSLRLSRTFRERFDAAMARGR